MILGFLRSLSPHLSIREVFGCALCVDGWGFVFGFC